VRTTSGCCEDETTDFENKLVKFEDKISGIKYVSIGLTQVLLRFSTGISTDIVDTFGCAR
jgi:hypothetical protein